MCSSVTSSALAAFCTGLHRPRPRLGVNRPSPGPALVSFISANVSRFQGPSRSWCGGACGWRRPPGVLGPEHRAGAVMRLESPCVRAAAGPVVRAGQGTRPPPHTHTGARLSEAAGSLLREHVRAARAPGSLPGRRSLDPALNGTGAAGRAVGGGTRLSHSAPFAVRDGPGQIVGGEAPLAASDSWGAGRTPWWVLARGVKPCGLPPALAGLAPWWTHVSGATGATSRPGAERCQSRVPTWSVRRACPARRASAQPATQ